MNYSPINFLINNYKKDCLNNYIENCDIFRDNIDNNIIQQLLEQKPNISSNSIKKLIIYRQFDYANMLLDEKLKRNEQLDSRILNCACHHRDFNILSNLINKYKIKPDNDTFNDCIIYNPKNSNEENINKLIMDHLNNQSK